MRWFHVSVSGGHASVSGRAVQGSVCLASS